MPCPLYNVKWADVINQTGIADAKQLSSSFCRLWKLYCWHCHALDNDVVSLSHAALSSVSCQTSNALVVALATCCFCRSEDLINAIENDPDSLLEFCATDVVEYQL